MCWSRTPVWVAALWWVSLSTIGFLVVPLLFSHLPTPALAGGMAAKLFQAQTWLSCACGVFLWLIFRLNKPLKPVNTGVSAIVFVATGVALALLSQWLVAPQIVARQNLRFWHSAGSVLYVLQWLCATATFARLTAPRLPTQV